FRRFGMELVARSRATADRVVVGKWGPSRQTDRSRGGRYGTGALARTCTLKDLIRHGAVCAPHTRALSSQCDRLATETPSSGGRLPIPVFTDLLRDKVVEALSMTVRRRARQPHAQRGETSSRRLRKKLL